MGVDTVQRTFVFVDLAGFSALTEAHGDADAVALVDRFVADTRTALSPGDELVKSIGDAVMLASPQPASAIATLSRLWQACGQTNGFPLPRAAAHHGSAIARDGDYFGAAVNLTARLSAQAGGGQLLATVDVAEAARVSGVEVADLGERRLRNLAEPVRLFDIRLGPAEPGDTVDPVCRMRVDREWAAGSLTRGGRHFWFCSLDCAAAFAANPDRYLATPATEGT